MANFAYGTFTTSFPGELSIITGLGFTPKAIIIWSNWGNNGGYITNCGMSYGFGTSSIAQGCIGWRTETAKASSNTVCVKSKTYIIQTLNTTADTVRDAAYIQSLDSDGFTLMWDIFGINFDVHYIALGGNDISVKFGNANCPTSTGNQAITGIGFRPTGLITLFNYIQATDAAVNDWARYNIGFAGRPNISQYAICGDSQNTSSAAGEGGHYNNKLFKIYLTITDERICANLVSLDSDGWTVNWDVVPVASDVEYLYLAIGGIDVNVGTMAQAVTPNTGNQSVSTMDFKPMGTMFISSNQENSRLGLMDAWMRTTISCGVSSTNRGNVWTGDRGNGGKTLSAKGIHSNRCFSCVTEGFPTVTENSIANFVSNDSNGFTINNTTVDAYSRTIGYMSFSLTPPPPIISRVKDIITRGMVVRAR